MRFALFFLAIWLAVAVVLIFAACSRYLFDADHEKVTLKKLFQFRIFAAFGWWFMWLSPRGRETLVWLIMGDEE